MDEVGYVSGGRKSRLSHVHSDEVTLLAVKDRERLFERQLQRHELRNLD